MLTFSSATAKNLKLQAAIITCMRTSKLARRSSRDQVIRAKA